MAGSGTAHLRDADAALLRVENLYVEFPIGRSGAKVHAVSDVSIDAKPGETLGLVGESGCGKSTTGKAIMRIETPTSGSVRFDGHELTELAGPDLRQLRPQMQMIFQDPISSLNPRRKVGDIVAEPLRIWASFRNPPNAVVRAAQRVLQATAVIGALGFAVWLLFWLVNGFLPWLMNSDFVIAKPAYESLLSNSVMIMVCGLLGGIAYIISRSVRDRAPRSRIAVGVFALGTALLAATGYSSLYALAEAVAIQTSVDAAAFEVPEDAQVRSSSDGTTTVSAVTTIEGSDVTVDVSVNEAPVASTTEPLSGVGSAALLVGQWGAVALALLPGVLLLLPGAMADYKRMAGVREEQEQAVRRVLSDVGLDPDTAMSRRPAQFSGGQCQRICVARALILDPKVIICDEPVSALDVSVQAQILNLLEDMKERYNLTLVFIAHDLAVVKNVSDRVAVMYLGKICEVAPPDDLYANPAHPYTAALLSSIPVPDPSIRPREEAVLGGEIPSPVAPPSGCRFRTRCPRAQDRCAQSEPKMSQVALGHYVACHFPLEMQAPKPRARAAVSAN